MSGRDFVANVTSVGAARNFVVDALDGQTDDVLECVRLMVSELATNAVVHAASGFRVDVLHVDHEIRVEVSDAGDGRPEVHALDPEALGGRGLHIVQKLASSWGVDEGGGRKTVWFVVRESEGARGSASSNV